MWEWNTRTGAFDLDSTTMLLRRLDNPSLSLEGDTARRDLALKGEIAAQAAAADERRRSEPEPPPTAPASRPEEWSLQTWALDVGGGRNPYDSASDGGRPGSGDEQIAWSLRSGRGRRQETASGPQLPDRERGYNPYGDEPPPRRRR